MSSRDSKLALAEAARLLGCDTAAARAFLPEVQHHAGAPVPYRAIVDALRENGSADARAVARHSTHHHGPRAHPPDPTAHPHAYGVQQHEPARGPHGRRDARSRPGADA